MTHFDLESLDVDGAIREGAEQVAGDTRLSFLRKGAVAGGAALSGGAILSALVPGMASAEGAPPKAFGKGDIGILNFALTLEYLERAFYNEATAKDKITDPKTAAFLRIVTKDERAHVDFLEKGLGKAAIKKPKFNFHGTTGDQNTFQQTALRAGEHRRARVPRAGRQHQDTGLPAGRRVDRDHRGPSFGCDRFDHRQVDRPEWRVRHGSESAATILKAVKGTGFIVG